jgi:cysteine desulfurase
MFHRNKTIYLDHAAGTPLEPVVFSAMKPFFTEQYANPSALYAPGVEAKNAIEVARERVAKFLHATDDSIVFTRGGTQSINIAILGVALKYKDQGKHIVTTAIDHHAVLNTCKKLEKEGFEFTYLPVDKYGFITVDAVKNAIREDTILVSVMYANNEVGVIEPIVEIGRMILQHRKKNNTQYPLFHTDACQAAGSLDMSVERMHVDLLSFNGSKIYGPKDVGVLYKQRGVELEPIIFGGGQEFGFSPGTENVAGIVGIGSAVSMIGEQRKANSIAEMRNYLWNNIKEIITAVVLNGPELNELRLENNLNVSFFGADSEAVILYLDAKGIFVSSGSACTTDSDEVSHVLLACGYDQTRMKSSIRFSLGRGTTKADIDKVLKVLPEVIQKVRNMKK